jgi:hypothetical protein
MPDTTLPASAAPADARERAIRTGIGVLAAVALVTGVWQALAPSSFRDALGPFGVYNEHFVRDIATWTLAYGGALVVAVGNASWRVPLLSLGVAQGALHLVNHIIDIGDTDPGWVGAFDAISLAALLAATWWLLSACRAHSAAETDR